MVVSADPEIEAQKKRKQSSRVRRYLPHSAKCLPKKHNIPSYKTCGEQFKHSTHAAADRAAEDIPSTVSLLLQHCLPEHQHHYSSQSSDGGVVMEAVPGERIGQLSNQGYGNLQSAVGQDLL
jgi:hypothetical protein